MWQRVRKRLKNVGVKKKLQHCFFIYFFFEFLSFLPRFFPTVCEVHAYASWLPLHKRTLLFECFAELVQVQVCSVVFSRSFVRATPEPVSEILNVPSVCGTEHAVCFLNLKLSRLK